jgi:hypothetical protein
MSLYVSYVVQIKFQNAKFYNHVDLVHGTFPKDCSFSIIGVCDLVGVFFLPYGSHPRCCFNSLKSLSSLKSPRHSVFQPLRYNLIALIPPD